MSKIKTEKINFNNWTQEMFWNTFSSSDLCETFSKYFKIWWNSNEFDWSYSYYLPKHCSEYFETWWDSDKFHWLYSYYLAKYCSRYFKVWWNSDKFTWLYSNYLTNYCLNYKYIWGKDYLKKKLINGY